jgi:hypothetical protein
VTFIERSEILSESRRQPAVSIARQPAATAKPAPFPGCLLVREAAELGPNA